MKSLLHGFVGRMAAEAGTAQTDAAAERQMQSRERNRAYWADWRSNPSQLAEIHAMYAREGRSGHR